MNAANPKGGHAVRESATPASPHDFHDPGYARRWAARAALRTPARDDCMACIAAHAAARVPPRPIILEYGCGPGFLAERLLSKIDAESYWLLDSSQPMLELCARRLRRFAPTPRLVKRDFTRPDWLSDAPCRPDLVVSMQATHEARGKWQTLRLYEQVLHGLAPAGAFFMCDLIADRGAGRDRSVFLTLAEHLDLLDRAGFQGVTPVWEKGGLGLILALERLDHHQDDRGDQH